MEKKFKSFLKKQYRFVIINSESLQEKRIAKLSVIKFISLILFFVLSFFLFTFCVIVYSPLNQYIPGKSSDTVQDELIKLSLKSDSLQRALYVSSIYLKNFEAIISGESSLINFSQDTTKTFSEKELSLNTSKEDSLLRIKVEREDLGAINQNLKKARDYFLFYSPLDGMISDSFNLSNNHFGVDLVAKKGTKIKAISSGTIIVSDWNPETGYVIGVQHQNNFISFYKHCSRLLKKTGDVVELGEYIAVIGNSGELSTGPHLHFELWQNGTALNPENYISF